MIVSVEQVKKFLRIDTSDDDALIEALIPEVEGHYELIRNAPFERDEDDNIVYPKGSALTAALMVGYQLQGSGRVEGKESESLGDYSYSRAVTDVDEYPAHIIGSIRRYVRAK